MEKFRKLTPHDLAFGIGRKATDEELRELLSRADRTQGKDAMQVLEEINAKLEKKNINKAS